MAQYMVSVCHADNPDFAPGERERTIRDVDALNEELQTSGAFVFAAGLHPSSTATTLRAKGSDVITTDGPFAEGAEHIGGFWIINTDDLDAALEWGQKAVRACAATIEVRPVAEEPPS
ncbi:MAG: hypothetical protein JF887_01730 [Candidatus Dormibacteraeota bacterium]|uniref:YCII-related domain-containing protein n=1 Tax=Candidatus Amunia macphersoniae TaxID=3127014 RepID=A0A934N8Q3_9BACT|nr:hypothetical protein [Candidatus Dormibacteraeota bacterium]